MMVQRALSCRDLSSAKKAMIGSGFFVFIQFSIFLIIGTLLKEFYQSVDMSSYPEAANYISNGIQRQSFGKNNHNAPKLLEKYNNLAREALSNGDKILSENYYQHADHFLRIMSDQNVGLNNLLDKEAKESKPQTDNNNNDENKSVIEMPKQNKEI